MSTTAIAWHDEHWLLGVRVRAHFFEPAALEQSDPVQRLLPVLAGSLPRSLHRDGERGSYAAGDLQACPDAVFEHGNGLLCLSHRHADKRSHERDGWPRQLRADLMLQAIVSAMAVSGQAQKPVAALLRCENVLYQFDPSPAVLECLASHIGAARRYAGESGRIGVQQLAAFCEPRIRALPAPPDDAGPANGAGTPPRGGAATQWDKAFEDTTPTHASADA